jgi:hypothetical protein
MAVQAPDEISAELSRIEETATYSAQTQLEQAKIWRSIYLWLGVPAAVLAAVTGGSLLADLVSAEVAGASILVSASLGAVLTSLNAAERGQQCEVVGNEYVALQSAARVARDVDLPVQPFDEARVTLGELMDRRDEINRSAPTPSRWAWKRAKRNVESGGQTFAVDKDR